MVELVFGIGIFLFVVMIVVCAYVFIDTFEFSKPKEEIPREIKSFSQMVEEIKEEEELDKKQKMKYKLTKALGIGPGPG